MSNPLKMIREGYDQLDKKRIDNETIVILGDDKDGSAPAPDNQKTDKGSDLPPYLLLALGYRKLLEERDDD